MCQRFSLISVQIAISVIARRTPSHWRARAMEPTPSSRMNAWRCDTWMHFNTRDLDVMREVFADQVLVNGEAYDQAAYLESVQMYFLLSPDIMMEPTFIVTADEHVTLRLEFSGTGQGEFLGHDISDQEYEVSEIMVFRVADGRFAEQWYEWDELGFLTQLGILESPYGQ